MNAKNHEREAAIIAQAGRTGAVTIATNMAGRGTDILLGGNADVMAQTFLAEQLGEEVDQATPEQIQAAKEKAQAITKRESVEVRNAGGLCVIGTERHESRRIDNQLRGRSGRQGDPGTTQFYLSLEDDLMRLFGGSRMDSISRMMEKPICLKICRFRLRWFQKQSRRLSVRLNQLTSPPVSTFSNTTMS